MIVRALAELEIQETAMWYEDQQEGVSFKFLDAIDETSIYRLIGVLFGTPIGALAGLVSGIAASLWNLGTSNSLASEP